MLLKGALFLLLALSAHARNTYMITAQRRITLGQTYSVNVNILNAKGKVNVEVSILQSRYDRSVYRYMKTPIVTINEVFEQDKPRTVTLMVPRVPTTGSYVLKVKGTGGLIFEREMTLYLVSKTISAFVQTDKAMYKPGQTVRFRTFSVYPSLKIYNGPINVDIFDPRGNRIRRWVSISEQSGVSEEELKLSDQPVLGNWKIEVTVPEFTHMREYKYFSVQQYELPKFEVTVKLPPFALISDDILSGTVTANYTFGEGVKGLAEVRVFVGSIRGQCGTFARSVHKAFPIDGSAGFSIPMAEIKKIRYYLNYQTITVVAEVKEELTGKTLNGSSTVTYYTQPYKISFLESSPNTFKPGLPYTAYVKVTQQDGRPVNDIRAGVQVYTCVQYERRTKDQSRYECGIFSGTYDLPVLDLEIPPDGVTPVDVEIPDNVTQVRMRAYYKDARASRTVHQSQSPSNTFIQARLRTQNLKAGDEAVFDVQATSPLEKVFYQIASRGSVVHSSVADHTYGKAHTMNTVTLKVGITATMSPTATLLVYYVKPDGEIVADSMSFNVEGVFENKVSIGFDKNKTTPHSDVMVNVNADLKSNVYVLAVDQSVLLLKSGNDITTEKVMNELRTYDPSAPRLSYANWRYPVPASGQSAQQIFQHAYVAVITDALLYAGVRKVYYSRPYTYAQQHPYPTTSAPVQMAFAEASSMRVDAVAAPQQLQDVERVRNLFPETWLWIKATIGSELGESLKMTVPDTITSWIASAFAVNTNSGLGVASTTAKLTVFRSFFVSLNLPLSVVKGETVIIQASVFNYLESDQQVTVTLKANSGIKIDGSKNQQTVRVQAGETEPVYFPVVTISLGMVDIEVTAQTPVAADGVKRQLTVKPKGIRRESNTPVLIDLTSASSFRKRLRLRSPQGLVKGSERIRMSITGDLLGPTIDNLEDLLALPTGCGEQTLLKFAPDIYIANYLAATKQMTPQLDAKITAYLEVGYQRLLSYQRRDRSFSTFGERDEAGSVWLTSFIAKVFHQAQPYIYIDSNTIDSAVMWLMSKQTSSGGFVEPGRVIDRQLQGGTGSGPGLTANVLATLVETSGRNGSRVNTNRLQQTIQNAAMYLEKMSFEQMNSYTLAITTYALSLAESPKAHEAFSLLINRSEKQNGKMYWDVNDGPTTKNNAKVESIDVVTTSLALLTFVEQKKFTEGMGSMRWLTSQRSRRGGFMSSLDTTMALEALTKFLVEVQPEDYDIKITVKAGTTTKHFNINNRNALVLQTFDLPSLPKNLRINAKGNGTALVELGMIYNVISNGNDNDVFDVNTVLLEDAINDFTLMTCAKHLAGGSSGMCVASIQIPSGFKADLSSADNIAGLKRLEQKGQTVVAYFDEIGTSSTCFPLSCTRANLVVKHNEAYISIVDYYKPEDHTVTSYLPRALKDSEVCDVCQDCPGCGEQEF